MGNHKLAKKKTFNLHILIYLLISRFFFLGCCEFDPETNLIFYGEIYDFEIYIIYISRSVVRDLSRDGKNLEISSLELTKKSREVNFFEPRFNFYLKIICQSRDFSRDRLEISSLTSIIFK